MEKVPDRCFVGFFHIMVLTCISTDFSGNPIAKLYYPGTSVEQTGNISLSETKLRVKIIVYVIYALQARFLGWRSLTRGKATFPGIFVFRVTQGKALVSMGLLRPTH